MCVHVTVPIRLRFLVFLISPHPPSTTLFPYTTLFRSASPSPRDWPSSCRPCSVFRSAPTKKCRLSTSGTPVCSRSEEHTSELQSRGHLVCGLLLEKKNILSDLRRGADLQHPTHVTAYS